MAADAAILAASVPRTSSPSATSTGRPSKRPAEKFPEAKKFTDFRKLFDRPQDFDAVVVSTCEHTHALATMRALKHKKHVYCEKPLTHDVYEARQIRLAAKEAGTTTQMGIQIHATENYRRVVELIQSGAIGPVKEAHVWVGRAWGWQSKEDAEKYGDRVFVTERPQRNHARSRRSRLGSLDRPRTHASLQ